MVRSGVLRYLHLACGTITDEPKHRSYRPWFDLANRDTTKGGTGQAPVPRECLQAIGECLATRRRNVPTPSKSGGPARLLPQKVVRNKSIRRGKDEFLRRASDLLRRASDSLQRAKDFLQRAKDFLRRAKDFLRRASHFLRRASDFALRTSKSALRRSRTAARTCKNSRGSSEMAVRWGQIAPARSPYAPRLSFSGIPEAFQAGLFAASEVTPASRQILAAESEILPARSQIARASSQMTLAGNVKAGAPVEILYRPETG